MADSDAYQGDITYSLLRVIGWLELVASIVVALWISSEYGTYYDPRAAYPQPTSNPLAFGAAIAIALQGVIVWALFLAIASTGDNVVALRRQIGAQRLDPMTEGADAKALDVG